MRRVALLGLAAGVLLSCAGRPSGEAARRTCVVLSVGGSAGLAHLGALDALRQRGITPDCVVGNSMGALVGSLYVTAPQEELKARYRSLVERYRDGSREAAAERGRAGADLGRRVAGLLGVALEWCAALGRLLGVASTPEASLRRLERTLDQLYAHAHIEEAALPFVTFYQRREGQGLTLVKAERGNLAAAVAASASNPFLFRDVDVRRGEALDAGADRVAAVPVHDACEAFPRARLLVINVTGRPAFYGRDLGCEVREVHVDVRFPPASRRFGLGRREAPGAEALRGEGEAFEAAYRAGWDAVMARSDLE